MTATAPAAPAKAYFTNLRARQQLALTLLLQNAMRYLIHLAQHERSRRNHDRTHRRATPLLGSSFLG